MIVLFKLLLWGRVVKFESLKLYLNGASLNRISYCGFEDLHT